MWNTKQKIPMVLAMCLMPLATNAQVYPYDSWVQMPTTDLYDTNLMLQSLNMFNMAMQTEEKMYQRASAIMDAAQPYRMEQYRLYSDKKYSDAIDVFFKAHKAFVYYENDNRGIADMIELAADCAFILRRDKLAIDLYKKARKTGLCKGIDNKLSNMFDVNMLGAREAYKKRDYAAMVERVSTALETDWESGEAYYFYGVAQEYRRTTTRRSGCTN